MDVTTTFVSNVLGLLLLATIVVCNSWRIRDRSRENLLLTNLTIIAVISCVVDPLSYCLNGIPGAFERVVTHLANSWLYFANIIGSTLWVSLVAEHVGHKLSRRHILTIRLLTLSAFVLLVINVFYPVIYELDEGNIYSRREGYIYFLVIVFFFLFDGLAIYLNAMRHRGVLKFFPVWIYLIPVLFGAVLQSVHFGISVVWPCVAISIAGAVTGLQNELMFRDKLTGLYNRFYLDNLKVNRRSSKRAYVGSLLIDLNGFKHINDTLGHATGDEALKDAANIMHDAVGTDGIAVRYAGDEFVILLNTDSQEVVDKFVELVTERIEEFNASSSKPYKLSISMGSGVFNLNEMTMNEILNEIDARMYQTKRAYYMKHDRRKAPTTE